MFAVIIAGALNTVVLSCFVLLTYFRGYNYFLNKAVFITQNDIYTSIYFSIAVSAILVLVFSTGVSDFFFNLISRNREPISREKELLYPLLEDVNSRAAEKFNMKKLPVKLKIRDTNIYNMAAVGLRTVVINRKIYEDCSPTELKGLIAHEVGHLYNGDSIYSGIACILSGSATIFILLCSGISSICAVFLRNMRGLAILTLPFIATILLGLMFALGVLFLFYWTFHLFVSFYFRHREYKTDKFAFDLGYGKELINFFEATKDSDYELKGIKKHLFATHPKTILRIGRLEKAKVVRVIQH